MNSDENKEGMKRTGGTELKQEQTNTMINTINSNQSRLNNLEKKNSINEKKITFIFDFFNFDKLWC